MSTHFIIYLKQTALLNVMSCSCACTRFKYLSL